MADGGGSSRVTEMDRRLSALELAYAQAPGHVRAILCSYLEPLIALLREIVAALKEADHA